MIGCAERFDVDDLRAGGRVAGARAVPAICIGRVAGRGQCQCRRARVDDAVLLSIRQQLRVVLRKRHLRRDIRLPGPEDAGALAVLERADVVEPGRRVLAGNLILRAAAEDRRVAGADQVLILGVHRTVHLVARDPVDVAAARGPAARVIERVAARRPGVRIQCLVHGVPEEVERAERAEAGDDCPRDGRRPGDTCEHHPKRAAGLVDQHAHRIVRTSTRAKAVDPDRAVVVADMRGRARDRVWVGRRSRDVVGAVLPPTGGIGVEAVQVGLRSRLRRGVGPLAVEVGARQPRVALHGEQRSGGEHPDHEDHPRGEDHRHPLLATNPIHKLVY